MRYEMEIVGTNRPIKIAEGVELRQQLANKILPAIGLAVQNRIKDKINSFNFKSGTGSPKMRDAVKVKVDKERLEVLIYNDTSLAPYAIWQEKGVHKHKMEYLIGKIIPYKIIDGHFVFAGRGSKFFLKDKNVKFARITAESFNRVSPSGKPAWEHPGYPGKFFYRDGLREALVEIQQHLKSLTFRAADGSSEERHAK